MNGRWLALFAGALVLPACPAEQSDGGTGEASTGGASTGEASSGETTDPLTTSGVESSSSDESSSTTEPLGEFDRRIQPIIAAHCTCHLSMLGSGGLSLLPSSAYANLVGVPSAGAPLLTRVVPSDSAASYVMMKLEGTHLDNGGLGSRMPLGATLPPALIDEIAAWIDEGAPE